MGANSKIEWTDATWNPFQGCHKISAGCKNCYMFREKQRYGQDPNVVVRSSDKTFYAPPKWKEPRMIFTCSWSDFFIEEADPWRDDAWGVIRQTPQHTYQILTKRPERIYEHLPKDFAQNFRHVWLGVSIEDESTTERALKLGFPFSTTLFVSFEPLLENIECGSCGWFDWIIVGGESGPNARPMKPDWVRQIRDDCIKKAVPFFFKQWGGNKKIDGVWGGRELDGRTWDEMPTACSPSRGANAMSEYVPYVGFYDLRDFVLPKKLFKKLWNIQDMLSHMRDRAEYFKKWLPGQWQKAKEVSADYQRILFQHKRKYHE